MSQHDVLAILRKQPDTEFSTQELAEKLDVKVNIANVWITKLDKWGRLVDCRKQDGKKYVKLAKK
jgi:biotin operon repressor